MKLKNVLIVVSDIERSRKYYHDLFGLEMILDNDGNMILTEGLVLQDAKIWQNFLGADIAPRSNASELYFEERDIEGFIQKAGGTLSGYGLCQSADDPQLGTEGGSVLRS